MDLPKVLMLVIYSPSELYDAQRDFWRRYMNSSPNISCYFITLSDVSQITLDGDILRIPGVESYDGIILKTLAALEYFLDRNSYDFVVRTNISSVWDYPRLLRHLAMLPRNGLYYGSLGGIRGTMRWASGSGMIMTPDVCRKLLDARELALGFKIIDDVDIGYTFEKIGVPLVTGLRNDTYTAEAPIPTGFYHQRVRLLPQPSDVVRKTIKCMEFILTDQD